MSAAPRFFAWLSTRPKLVIAVALLAGLLGLGLASRLALHTAFSELLPDDDPGVIALKRTQKRMGDLTLLLVGVRSPDPAANERYASALTDHLRGLPPGIVDIATYHMRDLRSFLSNNRWLYASEADLEGVRDRLRREIGKRKNPLMLDLGDPEEDKALEERLKGQDVLGGKFADGLFSKDGGRTLWIIALPPGGLLVERAGELLLAEAGAFVGKNPPHKFHPQMDVQVTGPVVTPIRNREALERDLKWVVSLCMVLIPLSLALYFRRLRAVAFVFAPALLATVLTYGVAYLAFGHLTTVTSFLVSFVMGNGTNYAIVMLSRYEGERRAGLDVRAATLDACNDLWRSTGVAALASALSYLSLMVTSFRGFSQFGLMGAAGCLLAWASTFTVMPALLTLFDRKGPGAARPRQVGRLLPALAAFIQRRPALVLGACGVTTAVLAVGVRSFRQEFFEYDFRKLSTPSLIDERARNFDRDHEELFGRWPSPTHIVVDRHDDVESLRAAIRRADQDAPGSDVIGQITTINDVLPGTPEAQARKLGILAQIRKLASDPALELLEGEEKEKVERLRPPDSLRVLTERDLPPLARRPFTEADGTVGRVVLVYPVEEGLSVWDGKALLRIAAVLQRITLPDGRVVETSGSAVIFAAMIRSILKDGPLATTASLLAVVLLVFLRVRPKRAAVVVVAGLLLGVLWMVGMAGWLGVKITFLNFIALPFIFGVGVEYAIHMVSEFRETGDLKHTIVSAGGAVALCSWSAIVGYGSLLAARSGALRGLGMMATMGEIFCLLAALIAIPALLARRPSFGRRADPRQSGSGS